MVLEQFHRWIKVFGKKQLERMPTRKIWDHAIDIKEGFVPRKGKVYLLSREEREEVHEFIQEQLRKVLWDAWDMNNFYFLFLLFSDFIRILLSFCFLFFFDDEEARDITVT